MEERGQVGHERNDARACRRGARGGDEARLSSDDRLRCASLLHEIGGCRAREQAPEDVERVLCLALLQPDVLRAGQDEAVC